LITSYSKASAAANLVEAPPSFGAVGEPVEFEVSPDDQERARDLLQVLREPRPDEAAPKKDNERA